MGKPLGNPGPSREGCDRAAGCAAALWHRHSQGLLCYPHQRQGSAPRRFLHRETSINPRRVCAYNSATFCDERGAINLQLVKQRAAKLVVEVDEMAAQQIKDNWCINNIILAGSTKDVERMKD